MSDSNVRSFALGNHAVAMQTADLVIGECVPKTLPGQDAQSLDELYPDEGYNCGFGFGCNVAPAIPTPLRAVWPLSLLMLSAFLRRTRGRNR